MKLSKEKELNLISRKVRGKRKKYLEGEIDWYTIWKHY